MSHKVIPFTIEMFKVTAIVSSEKKSAAIKNPIQYLKRIETFFKRTNCSTIINCGDYLLVSKKDNQFTISDYRILWGIYKKQEGKQLNPVPDYIELEFTTEHPIDEEKTLLHDAYGCDSNHFQQESNI